MGRTRCGHSSGRISINNRTVKQYSADKQARFGCKGKQKFWFGYKGHVGVDMRSGLIEKAAVTPANVSDQAGFKSICPRDGQLVFGDKAYCLKAATDEMTRRGVTCGAILRQNMTRTALVSGRLAAPNRWIVPKIGIIIQKSSKLTKLPPAF